MPLGVEIQETKRRTRLNEPREESVGASPSGVVFVLAGTARKHTVH